MILGVKLSLALIMLWQIEKTNFSLINDDLPHQVKVMEIFDVTTASEAEALLEEEEAEAAEESDQGIFSDTELEHSLTSSWFYKIYF